MSDKDNAGTSPACDVLIIEDDPTQGEELGCYLERAGLRVAATTSASLAIHTIGELRPKVALIDYNLPDLDGVTVAERIRRLSPGTAMIMMSGRIDALPDVTLAATGIFAFMNKPMSLGALRQSVLKIIRATARDGHPPIGPKKKPFSLPFGAFGMSRNDA